AGVHYETWKPQRAFNEEVTATGTVNINNWDDFYAADVARKLWEAITIPIRLHSNGTSQPERPDFRISKAIGKRSPPKHEENGDLCVNVARELPCIMPK